LRPNLHPEIRLIYAVYRVWVGEVGVVQQVGKVRAEPRDEADEERVRESKNRS
jgi:hypothetical protein